jgi:NAD(P)-dependent dehydrogenase (short-subunit alcohol dehydrogenase family)
MGRLDNKIAIITGGAGGIGMATGKRFAAEGAQVLLADHNADALAAAVESIGSDRVHAIEADVTREADNKAMVDAALERFGGLDIFVANAGIGGEAAPLADQSPDTFDRVMQINVKGPFLGLQAAVPALTERGGGSIIMTSSVAGIAGYPMIGPYVASKHAVVGLMRSAAHELTGAKIRVNTINPAATETAMMRQIETALAPDAPHKAKAQFEALIPAGRYAEPEEIASLMLYLASDESAFITGSVHRIDGGARA